MIDLHHDIFSIDQIKHENGTIKAMLGLHAESDIFKGHFPDQPVVPGACMLQLIKDVLETALKSKFRLKKADYLKFVCMIVPSLNDTVQLELSYKSVGENINVTAKLIASDSACFKFQGSFVKV